MARALEELARIARPLPVRTLRGSVRAQALLRARLCYDHLAGRLGVALLAALVDHRTLAYDGASYRITAAGRDDLVAFGIDPAEFPRRRPTIRYCVDWGEGRHHLAGALGGAFAGRLFDLDWLRRGRARRVVRLTPAGTAGLHDTFGLPTDWAGDR